MTRPLVRATALLLLLAILPLVHGCAGGGLIEFALTIQKLYGIWKLYQVLENGNPTWIEAAVAIYRFQNDLRYVIEYYDAADTMIAMETGTWTVRDSVLLLEVEQSTIDPSLVGKTVRVPGHFRDQAATTLSLTRRVRQGQVTVSQEQVFQRQPEP
jgi:hypothetical protein